MAIVFIHSGYSPYLEFSLRQARAASPESDIVLLGDAANDRFPADASPFVRHVNTRTSAYRAAAAEIADVYRHYSSNGAGFELACFERWFALRTFLRAEGLADALVLDSDVMLYASESELRRTWLGPQTALAVCRPAGQDGLRWMASPHVSYWTAATADAFCAFAVQTYVEPELRARYVQKWEHHLATSAAGGICDMTALFLFAEMLSTESVTTFAGTAGVLDGPVTVDGNVNDAENEWPGEFETDADGKAIRWDGEGRPTGRNRRLGRTVRFQALHFQGQAKARMATYYRGPAFGTAGAIGRRLRWAYAARRVESRAAQPARRLLGRLRRR